MPTTFDQPNFLCSKRFLLLFTSRFRYFRKYSQSYPQRGWGNLGFVIRSTHKRPLTVTAKV